MRNHHISGKWDSCAGTWHAKQHITFKALHKGVDRHTDLLQLEYRLCILA